ncbi:MAG TPA: FIST N-terminal domain-containing protein [Noviherbaspirillum sp.]
MMRARSASTTIADPYRAGLALGQELAGIEPEIVFLFVTTYYDDWAEFMSGLYDGLGCCDVRVIGTSGDGFFESSLVSDVGAAALGIDGGGTIRWHVESRSGVAADPEGAVRRALDGLAVKLEGRQPAFYFMVCDSSADGSRIEAVVHEEVNVPVIGGLAGDDTGKAGRGLLFMDGMHLKDAVVMLAVDGPLAFQIHLGNSMSPVGTPGIVDDAEGMMLRRIGGMEAVAFVEQQTGKSIMRSDQGIALKLIDPDDGDEQKLRAVNQAATADTSTLTLFGGIRNGSLVQVCMARPDALETEVHTVAAQAMHSNFVPAAALIISCAGRKWLMGGHIEHEVRFIEERFQHCLPLAGFPSFGEIGPMARKDGYTRNLFHNMTFVLLLLGTEIRPCAC